MKRVNKEQVEQLKTMLDVMEDNRRDNQVEFNEQVIKFCGTLIFQLEKDVK